MTSKTLISKEYVRDALESVRTTLLGAQTDARTALSALGLACTVVKSLDASAMALVALDTDIECRLQAVDSALERLDLLLDDEDVQALKDVLLPATSHRMLQMTGAPQGATLN